jgi:hypothetical protein
MSGAPAEVAEPADNVVLLDARGGAGKGVAVILPFGFYTARAAGRIAPG